jgi:Response receiver domain
MTDAYQEAIVETFRKNALRTAHIIDDSFPTYADLVEDDGAKEKFKEWRLAKELYDLFRDNHIPCDVENTVDSVRDDVNRIRKSDLIVLDYNLRPDDTRLSVTLVRSLARTPHFNTIIVYTAADDLHEVWLNFAAALRGGWSRKKGADDIERRLEDVQDEKGQLDPPSREMLSDHIIGRSIAVHRAGEWKAYGEALEKIDKTERLPIIEALIRREVRSFLSDDEDSINAEPRTVEGRWTKGGPLWLQSGNCFVAIMGKPSTDARAVAPEKLFEQLDAALCDWRPNLLQIIVSEVQNILESDAIATHEHHLRDPQTQVSLCYFLLMALGSGAPSRESLDGPIHSILDKLVEGVRQRLLADKALGTLAGDLLSSELDRLAIPEFRDKSARRIGLLKKAQQMAGRENDELDASEALLKLNAFLSMERFRGHLTTGTVFEHGGTHWVCMTPACDMVDRAPNDGQDWLRRIHPMKPIVAVRLKQKDRLKGLKDAELSRSLFIKSGDAIEAFDVLPDSGPSYEFIYLGGGALAVDGEHHTFQGFRVWRADGAAELPTSLEAVTYRIVGQVRADYASRFLQQTGAWLSRIGVDFIRAAN